MLLSMSLKLSIQMNNGPNVLLLLDISEIKQIVDHAGLMVQLKLIMTDFVLKPMVNSILCCQLLIQLLVVDFLNANQWVAMVDKLELLGHGSKALVL
jgi:hypothetical protein